MTTNQIEQLVRQFSKKAGLIVVQSRCPVNQDALVMLIGEPDGKNSASVSISGLEQMEHSNRMFALVKDRFEAAALRLKAAA